MAGLTVLEGDPGVSKTTVTLDWAARLSTGRAIPFPSGEVHLTDGCAILVQGEATRQHMKAQLIAAEGEPSRVFILGAQSAEDDWYGLLPRRAGELRSLARDAGVKLIVIDPLSCAVEGGLHDERRVRAALAPLARMAEDLQLVVVLVRHLAKGNRGNPLYDGAGSIAVTAAARSVLRLAEDPVDPCRRLLASAKNNLAKDVPMVAYTVQENLSGSRIEWLGLLPFSAKQIAMGAAMQEGTELHRAVQFLREFLAHGPQPAIAVYEVGKATQKLKEKTLDRAKAFLSVVSTKTGFGMEMNWVWALPPEPLLKKVEDAQARAEFVDQLTRRRRRIDYIDPA
jgi:hypothetical protein